MPAEKYHYLVNKYFSDNLSRKERDDLIKWMDANPDLESLRREIRRAGVDNLQWPLLADTLSGCYRMLNIQFPSNYRRSIFSKCIQGLVNGFKYLAREVCILLKS